MKFRMDGRKWMHSLLNMVAERKLVSFLCSGSLRELLRNGKSGGMSFARVEAARSIRSAVEDNKIAQSDKRRCI